MEDFLSYLEHEKRYSAHTVCAYTTDLNQFRSFLQYQYETADLAEATDKQIRSWLAALMSEGCSERSIHRKLSALKAYYKFKLKQGVVAVMPTAKVTTPKIKKKLPVFVEEKQMNKMLDDYQQPETFEEYRNLLIVEMFYASGIRLSELINLQDKNVDILEGTIKVLGKRNKERIIPIPSEVLQHVENYRNIKYLQFPETKVNGSLFIKNNGDKMYPAMVYKIVKNFLSAVALDKKSPHVLRHTYATHLLNNGADLNAIKELLGHAGLAATQVYTHNTIEKLKKIYNNAHPRA